MKNATRKFVLILAVVMTLTIITACSGGSDTTEPTSQIDEVENPPHQATSPATQAEEPTGEENDNILPSIGIIDSASLLNRWIGIYSKAIRGDVSDVEYLYEGDLGLDFFSDGNGALTEWGRVLPFTWSAEGNRLMMTQGRDTILADYEISGSTLTISFDEQGLTFVWTLKEFTYYKENDGFGRSGGRPDFDPDPEDIPDPVPAPQTPGNVGNDAPPTRNWVDAFRETMELLEDIPEITFYLYDMNNDGIPVLLITEPYAFGYGMLAFSFNAFYDPPGAFWPTKSLIAYDIIFYWDEQGQIIMIAHDFLGRGETAILALTFEHAQTITINMELLGLLEYHDSEGGHVPGFDISALTPIPRLPKP
ncbi:MAG: hypothetical protein FWF81_07445 [Defluviitaleaceae bacterium]|nr:hypothetical protein [Defluviitaleaceae bacterium]